jgi:hypothetical protein
MHPTIYAHNPLSIREIYAHKPLIVRVLGKQRYIFLPNFHQVLNNFQPPIPSLLKTRFSIEPF